MGQKNQKADKKLFKTNENGNTMYQNLCDAEKTVLSRKFIVISAYMKKLKISQTT